MEANYHTWFSDHQVKVHFLDAGIFELILKGATALSDFLRNVFLDADCAFPVLVFLLGYIRNFYSFSTRLHIIFPKTLVGGTMPPAPSWFIEVARQWTHVSDARPQSR